MMERFVNWVLGPRRALPRTRAPLLESCLNCGADLTTAE